MAVEIRKSGTSFKIAVTSDIVPGGVFTYTIPGYQQFTAYFVAEDVTLGSWETNTTFPISSLNGTFVFSLGTSANATEYIDNLTVDVLYSGAQSNQSHTINIPASTIKWNDTSAYPAIDGFGEPVIERTTVISRPESLGDISPSSDAVQATITPIYVGEWVSTLESKVTHVYNEDLSIVDTVSSEKRTYVSNSNDMCCLYAAMKSVYDRYNNAKCRNTELAERYRNDLNQVSNLFSLAQNAVSCGKLEDISAYVEEAKLLANINEDCSCPTANGDLILNIFGETFIAPVSGGELTSDEYLTDVTSNSSILEVTPSGQVRQLTIDETELSNFIANSESVSSLSSDVTSLSNQYSNVAGSVSTLNTVLGASSFDATDFNFSSSETIYGVLDDLDNALNNFSPSVSGLSTLSFTFRYSYINGDVFTDNYPYSLSVNSNFELLSNQYSTTDPNIEKIVFEPYVGFSGAFFKFRVYFINTDDEWQTAAINIEEEQYNLDTTHRVDYNANWEMGYYEFSISPFLNVDGTNEYIRATEELMSGQNFGFPAQFIHVNLTRIA